MFAFKSPGSIVGLKNNKDGTPTAASKSKNKKKSKK